VVATASTKKHVSIAGKLEINFLIAGFAGAKLCLLGSSATSPCFTSTLRFNKLIEQAKRI
jgi:hypothetical protein